MVRLKATSMMEILAALALLGIAFIILQQSMNVAVKSQSKYPQNLGSGKVEGSYFSNQQYYGSELSIQQINDTLFVIDHK